MVNIMNAFETYCSAYFITYSEALSSITEAPTYVVGSDSDLYDFVMGCGSLCTTVVTNPGKPMIMVPVGLLDVNGLPVNRMVESLLIHEAGHYHKGHALITEAANLGGNPLTLKEIQKLEYQADAYAVKKGYGRDLLCALSTMYHSCFDRLLGQRVTVLSFMV